jgi:MFS family permease
VLALVQGNSWGWGSPAILALLAVAAVALTAFVIAELRVDEPMVDFGFFRSKSFLGANMVAFIVSFAMLAMFFFLALYMQNIKGYSPLQAGVRFLPSTLLVVVAGPISGRLSDRIGPRPLMVTGLIMVAGAMFWQGHLAIDTSYGFLVGAFMLMGLGIGLVMSPMSTAAMNAVEPTKAGVASGILSMWRMVGGTFGVAVMGALITGLGKSKIDDLLPTLPNGQRQDLADGLGAGGAHVGGQIGHAVQQAYVYALNDGLRIGAAITLLGALLAWLLIADRAVAPSEAGAESAAGPAEAKPELAEAA